MWWMLAFGEMSMLPTNRVFLDPRKRDAWGIPAVRIECAHSARDEAQISAMQQTMAAVAEREGFEVRMPHEQRTARGLAFRLLRRVVFTPSGAFWPGASIHEVGGARMGSTPTGSVVNAFNQCWDAPNVLVCDAASFPCAGYQNHTLTIMAQTVRACEHLVAAARRGDL